RTKVLLILFLTVLGGGTWLLPAAGSLDLALAASSTVAAELTPGSSPSQYILPTEASVPIVLETDGANWELIPRAGYRIMARVLHSKQYDDWQASLSPVDLALGWGMLSEPRIDNW